MSETFLHLGVSPQLIAKTLFRLDKRKCNSKQRTQAS